MRDKPPKINPNTGRVILSLIISLADTPLPLFLPYPRFLFKMEISQTAKLLYSLLLGPAPPFPRRNKWQDDKGRIYIIYPIAEIAEYWIKAAPP